MSGKLTLHTWASAAEGQNIQEHHEHIKIETGTRKDTGHRKEHL